MILFYTAQKLEHNYNKNKSNDRVYDSLHFIILLNTIVNLTLRLKTTNKC